MMNLGKLFIIIIIWLPAMLLLVHGIIKPEASFMMGRRWQFKNEAEPSEIAVDMHRLRCIVGAVVMLVFLLSILLF